MRDERNRSLFHACNHHPNDTEVHGKHQGSRVARQGDWMDLTSGNSVFISDSPCRLAIDNPVGNSCMLDTGVQALGAVRLSSNLVKGLLLS